MSNFPHGYKTTATGKNQDTLTLRSNNLPDIEVTPPIQFNGTDNNWNPEALFSGAISTCFILTFRAITRAMNLEWDNLTVDVTAILNKTKTGLAFTEVEIFPHLVIGNPCDHDIYLKALVRAKESCLITNSINSNIKLHPTIE